MSKHKTTNRLSKPKNQDKFKGTNNLINTHKLKLIFDKLDEPYQNQPLLTDGGGGGGWTTWTFGLAKIIADNNPTQATKAEP